MGNGRRWLLFAFAMFLLTETAAIVWLSPRRPDVAIPGGKTAQQPAPAWAWLRYPFEVNAARRLPVLTGDWVSVSFTPEGRHGWLLGAGGLLLGTSDGGATWARVDSGATATAASAPAASPASASNGPAANAPDDYDDYGTPTNALANQMAPVQDVKGGGQAFDPKALASVAPAAVAPQAVRVDGKRGYLLRGDGTLVFTDDAGGTWRQVAAQATSLVWARSGRGWAVIEGTVRALDVAGGVSAEARPFERQGLTPNFLLREAADEAAHYPLHMDGTEVWLSRTERVRDVWPLSADAKLAALATPDARQGWLVADANFLWRTVDAGRTWYRASLTPDEAGQARAAGTYWWLPPVWSVLPLLAIVGLVMLAWSVPPATEPAEESVEDVLLSDRPLAPGEPDALGFTSTAAGLSNFIRNERTEPPLTLAITGEWGSGKSSLMNLLRGDLEARGLRPVWFNAWHHQTEQRLLAALLENVRAQAVPGWLSAGGLTFRLRLLRTRVAAERARWTALGAVLLFSVGFLVASDQLTRSHLSALANPLTELPGLGEVFERLATAVTGERPADAAAAQPASAPVEQGGLMAAILAGLLATWRIFAALRAFGVRPASLLAVNAGNAKLKDLSAQTSFRYEFAREFAEVTHALGARRLVIFIDDVDRCQPAEAYEILEAANFLVSSGACFVVLGLARQRVEQAVGLVFAEQAEAQEGADTAEARQKFARNYLEKLINIEVPVPAPREQALRGLFERRALVGAVEQVRRGERWLRVIAGGALLVCLLGGVGLGAMVLRQNRADVVSAAAKAAASGAATGTAANGGGVVLPEADGLTPATAELGAAAIVAPWLALVALLALALGAVAGWRLSVQPALVVRDSASFTQALNRWLPLLARRPGTTPRRLKRFVNRVRFYAMMQRGVRAEPTPGMQLGAWLARRWPWAHRVLKRWWGGAAVNAPAAEEKRDGQLSEAELIALTAALEMGETSNGSGPPPGLTALQSEVAEVNPAARARFADLAHTSTRVPW